MTDQNDKHISRAEFLTNTAIVLAVIAFIFAAASFLARPIAEFVAHSLPVT